MVEKATSYNFTEQLDATELDTIKEAMKRIERNTCIRFRKRTSEADYIDIQNERGEGCYTSVGRLTGSSVLMLEAGEHSTCVVTEIVQHELLHVIGLWHEHMRYDRDKYIRVNYRNILPGERSQFDIVSRKESTLYNIPYDYKSVMHYGKTAFARPGTVTMETLDPRYTNVIGKQTDASSSDYKKVCNIYDCKVCNSGITREDDGNTDSWKPGPNPIPEPEPSVDKECSDKLTNVCRTVKQLGVLDCNYDYAKTFCCATCNAGESGGPDVYYNDH
uniref:Metalloendopeptidase n=1 Tax=Angiostrongylus cantonensis TaxID=6313 RepID=A0A158PAV7_ANGCA